MAYLFFLNVNNDLKDLTLRPDVSFKAEYLFSFREDESESTFSGAVGNLKTT